MLLQRHNPASTIGFAGGAQKQESQPQKPELVNATKGVNHGPPQPDPFSDVLNNKSRVQPAFHPLQQNGQRENDIRIQVAHNTVNHGAIVQEVHKHRNDDFYSWSTEFYLPTTKYAETSGKDDLSGNYNGPQLKSDNHFHRVSPLKENVEAFRRIWFRPRVLVDVSRIDMSTTVLGYRISAPILVAPTAMHQLAHPEGEVATARAAAACNSIMILSYRSTCTVEEVASSCNAVRFFQIYVYRNRAITAQLVQRAERNGFKAIVLTVDVPKLGRREADIKNRMVSLQLKNFEGLITTKVDTDKGSNNEAFANSNMDPSLSWKDIGWLKSITNLPILVKGVLTREEALKAMEVGVAGIVVSNHGARQLDYSPATINVLEEVVHAVGGKIPVLFDGGIRRGTDIFKALALGAKAVLVGRPVVFGRAAKGERGVKRVLEMLKDELELTMALSGCPTLKDIRRSHVKTEQERFPIHALACSYA